MPCVLCVCVYIYIYYICNIATSLDKGKIQRPAQLDTPERRGSMASELAEYPPTGPQGHYECDVCHAVYPSYEAAAACEARHATGSGGGYFECDICGQAYPDFDQAAACEERHARDPRRRGRAVKPGGRQQQATGRRSRERGTN